ncbi:MAG: SAM-dependent methyltransferase, partial [Rhodobacteraceae bacterium]|nr:SAM-dependent methyltransferase [Paracoccaceae bacterium]
MEDTLHRQLSRMLKDGRLEVTYPSGRRESYGTGPLESAVRFADRRAMARVAHDPTLGVGALYMDGRL